MPKPPIALPQLGELELEVLEYLWRVGEADVIETHAAIGRRRKITLNTVGSTRRPAEHPRAARRATHARRRSRSTRSA